MATSQSVTVTTPIWGILQVAMIFCKIAEITALANWSWAWILLPTWIGLGFIVLMFLLAFIAFMCK